MKVKILRGVMISGEAAAPGEIRDVSDSDARIIIKYGQAEPVNPVPPPSSPEPQTKGKRI